jgi:hypothetical protein
MLDLKASATTEVRAGVFAFPAGGPCGPKVLAEHPRLQHGAWMLDGFAAHTQGWWVDRAASAALILERACAARLRQVNPYFVTIFISGEVVRQLLHLA